MAGRSKDPAALEKARANRREAEAEAFQYYSPAQLPMVKRSLDDTFRFTDQEKNERISEIFDRLINGQSLTKICNLPHMPAAYTFIKWIQASHTLAVAYVRAREIAAEFFAMDIVAISDDETSDPNSRKIRVDARKWAAARLLPKIYGDKIEVTKPTSPDAIPNGRIMDLVEMSDDAAEGMLLLEQNAPIADGAKIQDEIPRASDSADLLRESADEKKPGK